MKLHITSAERSTQPPKTCERCGAPLPPPGPGGRGRPRRFCSASCVSLNSRARSIERRGRSIAQSDPDLKQAFAAVSLAEDQVGEIRDAIFNATVGLMECVAPYTELVWQKVLPAARGQSAAAASLVEGLENLHQALEALLAVFERASLLDRSVLETLVHDPRTLPPFKGDGAVVAPDRCALPDCRRPLPPRSGPGRPRRYCSPRCRELDHLHRSSLQVAAEERRRLIAEASGRRERLIADAAAFAKAARQQHETLLAHRDACRLPIPDSPGQASNPCTPSLLQVLRSPEMTDWLRKGLTSLKRYAEDPLGRLAPEHKSEPRADASRQWSKTDLSSELRKRSDIVKQLASSLESAQTDLLNWRLN